MENKKFIVLKNQRQFGLIKSEGKSKKISGHFLITYIPNSLGVHRFGWTLPRYVGNAVTRNRLKRYCREFFRNNNSVKTNSYDVNLVFLKSAKDEFKSLDYKSFETLLKSKWIDLRDK